MKIASSVEALPLDVGADDPSSALAAGTGDSRRTGRGGAALTSSSSVVPSTDTTLEPADADFLSCCEEEHNCESVSLIRAQQNENVEARTLREAPVGSAK